MGRIKDAIDRVSGLISTEKKERDTEPITDIRCDLRLGASVAVSDVMRTSLTDSYAPFKEAEGYAKKKIIDELYGEVAGELREILKMLSAKPHRIDDPAISRLYVAVADLSGIAHQEKVSDSTDSSIAKALIVLLRAAAASNRGISHEASEVREELFEMIEDREKRLTDGLWGERSLNE